MNRIIEEINMALEDIWKLDDSPAICSLIDVINQRLPELDAALNVVKSIVPMLSIYNDTRIHSEEKK